MEPSECCIFRIVVASVVGAVVTTILLRHAPAILLVALVPVGGSLMALCAMVLFQSARPFVSGDPVGLDPDNDYFMRKYRFLGFLR